MAYTKPEKEGRTDAPMRRRPNRRRRKVCAFCADKEHTFIDYKDVNKLKRYISERGKILPRRLCKASESSYRCHQKSASHCFTALYSGLITDGVI